MNALVCGTPGSGKTTLVQYAAAQGNKQFFDADEIQGLCEWREFKTGKVMGLVTEFMGTGDDDWYQNYGWYWRTDVLKQFLKDNPDAIVCGSSENVVDHYPLFDRHIILRVTEEELFLNHASPTRDNPFGKTPKQRANFMNWQQYLIDSAKGFKPDIIDGNNTANAYVTVVNALQHDQAKNKQ